MEAKAFGHPALIGDFDPVEQASFRKAAERANADARVSTSISNAQDEISELRPKCIFVDADSAELAKTAAWIREHPVLFATPLIAMVSDLRDSSFVRACRDGANDVIVRSNFGGVTRRIANLEEFEPSTLPSISRGRVLISHQVDQQRRLLGRTLRQASFDVHFAADAEEIINAISSETPPKLVVASEQILPVSMVREVRKTAGAPGVPFVVVSSMPSTRTMLDQTLRGVATISTTAPHDHLLFLANDLLTDGDRQLRKSPRYLFDTICSFRREGVFSAEYGLTYNLSETGIYVRTLDPPAKNKSLWLELTPPAAMATVHLRGTLIWVATPGKGLRATPPGFGLRIDASRSPARDLKLYREAYDALAVVPNKLAVTWRP